MSYQSLVLEKLNVYNQQMRINKNIQFQVDLNLNEYIYIWLLGKIIEAFESMFPFSRENVYESSHKMGLILIVV